MAYCNNCWTVVPEGVNFCLECGTPVDGKASGESGGVMTEDMTGELRGETLPGQPPEQEPVQKPGGFFGKIFNKPFKLPFRKKTAKAEETLPPEPTAPVAAASVYAGSDPEAPVAVEPEPAAPVPAETTAPPAEEGADAPVGISALFGMMVLYSIPLVGWIICIIRASTEKNPNRQNFAKAMLIMLSIGVAAGTVLVVLGIWVVEAFWEAIRDMFGGYY